MELVLVVVLEGGGLVVVLVGVLVVVGDGGGVLVVVVGVLLHVTVNVT